MPAIPLPVAWTGKCDLTASQLVLLCSSHSQKTSTKSLQDSVRSMLQAILYLFPAWKLQVSHRVHAHTHWRDISPSKRLRGGITQFPIDRSLLQNDNRFFRFVMTQPRTPWYHCGRTRKHESTAQHSPRTLGHRDAQSQFGKPRRIFRKVFLIKSGQLLLSGNNDFS